MFPALWLEGTHKKKSAAAMKKIFRVFQTDRKTLPGRRREKDGPFAGQTCRNQALVRMWRRSARRHQKIPLPIAAVNGRYQRICPEGNSVSLPEASLPQPASKRKNAPEPCRHAQRHRPSKAIQRGCADLPRCARHHPIAMCGTTTNP